MKKRILSILCLAVVLTAAPALAARAPKFDQSKFWALCRQGGAKAISEALKRGADVNGRDPDGWSPLMLAAQWNNAEVVRVLLEAGAEVNALNPSGWSPLMLAAQWNGAEVVGLLARAGADVHTREGDGWTALMIAALSQARVKRLSR